jgi:hypothetical protein
MSDQYLGNGRRIVTTRMRDGTLGRTLQNFDGRTWNEVKSVTWSAASRRVVICQDELDAHLRQVARQL